MSHQLSAVSYQIKKEPVGWLERSETQQVNEFLGRGAISFQPSDKTNKLASFKGKE